MRTITTLCGALALLLSSTPMIANAQVGGRVSGYFTSGFGGRVDVATSAPDLDIGRRDLSASLGGGLRLEAPVLGPLMLGGQIEHRRLDVSPASSSLAPGNTDGREGVTDFDLWIALNARPLRGPVGLDLYVGLPVGPALLTADGYRAPGFNVGAVAGARVFFGPVGLFAELGYQRHQFWVSDGTPSYRTYWQQMLVDVGASVRF